MIDVIRFLIGLQLMINGFVASVHLFVIAVGASDQFKPKAYVISSIVALLAFLFILSFPLIDKLMIWIKS